MKDRRRTYRLDGVSEVVLSRGERASVRGAILDVSLGGIQVGYLDFEGPHFTIAPKDTLHFEFVVPVGTVRGEAEVVASSDERVHLSFVRFEGGSEVLREFLESPLAGTPKSIPPPGG